MDKQQILNLAGKASKGDKEAFELLVKEKSEHILYLAYDSLKNHHDAEDAAQEIIVAMYRHIEELREPEYFNTWLQKIIQNVCVSKLRSSKYYKKELDVETIMEENMFAESLIEKDREFLPHAIVEDQALSSVLLDTVKSLPKKRRRVVLLYYYEDLSQKEIAEVMGISESTVATNILRAKNDIREKLEEKGGINLDEEKAPPSKGKFAAIPVLGQVLANDATTQFGPESIAQLMNFDYAGAADAPSQPSNVSSNIGVKVAALVTVAGVACGGAFLAAGDAVAPVSTKDNSDTKPMAQVEQVEENATETALAEEGEIVFAGGECDCGHENPTGITLDYNDSKSAGEIDYKWELVNESGGIVSEGTGRNVDSFGAALATGNYTAKFTLTDEDDNILIVERDFEIK